MSGATEGRFRVQNMDCPSCVASIRGHFSKVDGILAVEGSPIARTLTVSLDPLRASDELVRKEVARMGYDVRPLEDLSAWPWSATA